MLTSTNYAENVLRTEAPITEVLKERLTNEDTIRLLHAGMGLCTEAGEFMDMLKKHIFYGKPLDMPNLKEEIGDTYWYTGVAIDVLRTTINEVMTVNIEKLRARYPEKFTEVNAIDRNLEKERTILERK
jgi:NTP pyrophosphatase (non-canonical NTP hydrolase)